MIRDYRQGADDSGEYLPFSDPQLEMFAWGKMRHSQGFGVKSLKVTHHAV